MLYRNDIIFFVEIKIYILCLIILCYTITIWFIYHNIVSCLLMLYCNVITLQCCFMLLSGVASYYIVFWCNNFVLCLVMILFNVILLLCNVIMSPFVLLCRFVILYRCSLCNNVFFAAVLCCFVTLQRFIINYDIVLCLIMLFCNIIMLFCVVLCWL